MNIIIIYFERGNNMDISKRILESVKVKGKPLGEVLPPKEEVKYVKGDIGFVIYNSKINEKMHDVSIVAGNRGIYIDTVDAGDKRFSVTVNMSDENKNKLRLDIAEKVLDDIKDLCSTDYVKKNGAGLNILCEEIGKSLKDNDVLKVEMELNGVPDKALEKNINTLLTNIKELNPSEFKIMVNEYSDKYEKCIIEGKNMGAYDEDIKLKYDNASLDRYLPQNNPIMKSIINTFGVLDTLNIKAENMDKVNEPEIIM